MPWVRFYLYDWISGTNGMTSEQRDVYITLLVCMYEKKEPLKTDFQTLARICHCSQKKFAAIVEYLMKNDKLIETDSGLWNTRVEEELKDFADKKDHISQVRSEAGKKGVQAKNAIKQHVNNFAEANVKQNQAIKNQNKNIYKKTKTIILAKKEINSENLETNDLVEEPTEVIPSKANQNKTQHHQKTNLPFTSKKTFRKKPSRLTLIEVVDCLRILNPITILHLQRACLQSVSKSRSQSFEIFGKPKQARTHAKPIGKQHGVTGYARRLMI